MSHDEHLKAHKLYSTSQIEMPIWINRPETLWERIKYKLTGRPKPIFKTQIEIQKEYNKHISDHLDLLSGVHPVLKGKIRKIKAIDKEIKKNAKKMSKPVFKLSKKGKS